MNTIVKILVGLILAIVRTFTGAFVSLFERVGVVLVALAGILAVVLILSGALSVHVFRRRR